MSTHTAQTLAAFQMTEFHVSGTERKRKSGGEWRCLLLAIVAEVGDKCILCGTATNPYGEVSYPSTAQLTTLVQSRLLDDQNGIERMGWVPGNVAIAHVACARARRDAALASDHPEDSDLHPHMVDPSLVLAEWPKLRKVAATSSDPDVEMDLFTARMAAGRTY